MNNSAPFGNYSQQNKRLMLVSCRIRAVARMNTGGSLCHTATSLVNPGAKTEQRRYLL